MADEQCPRMSGCPMYPEFTNQAVLATLKELYCRGDYRSCARYRAIAVDGVIPPKNLLPNGKLLLRE